MGQDGSRRGERVARRGEAIVGCQGGVGGCAVRARILHTGGLHLRGGCRVGRVGGRGSLVALEVGLAVGGCDRGCWGARCACTQLCVHFPRRCVVSHILLHWLQLCDCGFHLQAASVDSGADNDSFKLFCYRYWHSALISMKDMHLSGFKLGGRLVLSLVAGRHLFHLDITLEAKDKDKDKDSGPAHLKPTTLSWICKPFQPSPAGRWSQPPSWQPGPRSPPYQSGSLHLKHRMISAKVGFLSTVMIFIF